MAAQSINQTHKLLSEHTRLAHKRLDSNPMFARLMHPSLNIEQYIDTLCCLYPWFVYFESYIEQTTLNFQLDLSKSLPHRINKSSLIQNDLQTLSAIDRMHVERYKQSIPSKNLAFSLGALYVIEGSTLGGSVISPKLEKTLDISHALTFYQCYGAQKFDNFNATMRLIELHISSKTDMNDLLNGAVFTFDSLDKWAKTFSALPECCDV